MPQRISLPVQQSRSVATPGSHHGAPSVVGKERVKFYSRPVLPGNQSLVPVIKYAPDVSRAGAGDDFTAEFLARRDSYDTVRRSVSNVASVSVQVWGVKGDTELRVPHCRQSTGRWRHKLSHLTPT